MDRRTQARLDVADATGPNALPPGLQVINPTNPRSLSYPATLPMSKSAAEGTCPDEARVVGRPLSAPFRMPHCRLRAGPIPYVMLGGQSQ